MEHLQYTSRTSIDSTERYCDDELFDFNLWWLVVQKYLQLGHDQEKVALKE